jgi:hypothetical protein
MRTAKSIETQPEGANIRAVADPPIIRPHRPETVVSNDRACACARKKSAFQKSRAGMLAIVGGAANWQSWGDAAIQSRNGRQTLPATSLSHPEAGHSRNGCHAAPAGRGSNPCEIIDTASVLSWRTWNLPSQCGLSSPPR